jgi:hypothetical protein
MRYRDNGQLDDPSLLDGDEQFIGFNTQVDRDSLEPGLLSYAQNVRLDTGSIKPRRSCKQVTTNSHTNQLSTIYDAITYNDGDSDRILVATPDRCYLHDGTTSSQMIWVSYPRQWNRTPQSIFLIQTSTSTLAFPDSSVTLPFNLDSNAYLGDQVGRLEDMQVYSMAGVPAQQQKEFMQWKQVSVRSIQAQVGDVRHFTCDEQPAFDIGEKIEVWKGINTSDNLGIYKVTAINGTQVECVPSDTDTRPTWSASSSVNVNANAYSIEDQCPPGRFATWAGNRLIVPTGRHDIAISSPLSTHDFPIYNALTIGSEDGGIITALEPLVDDSLVVFKDNSIYIVSGVYSMLPADQGGSLQITRISDQMGCVNNKSKIIIGQEVIFLSNQGLYALSLNTKGEGAIGLPPQAVRVTDLPLSKDIEGLITAEYEPVSPTETIYLWDRDSTQLFFCRGRLYVYCNYFYHGDYEDFFTGCLVYNTLLSRWESLDLYEQGFKRAVKLANNGSLDHFMLSENFGVVQVDNSTIQVDEYNDASPPIEVWFRTRGYRFRTSSNKIIRRVQLSGEAPTGQVYQGANKFAGVYLGTENPETDKLISDTMKDGTFNSKIQTKSQGESVLVECYFYDQWIRIKRIILEARDIFRQTISRN